MKIGDKVTYTPKNESGIIKSFIDGYPDKAFVVFSCGDDWDNYQNYTGQSVLVKNLIHGWRSPEDQFAE